MSLTLQTIQKINSVKKMLVRQTEWELLEVSKQQSEASELLNRMQDEVDHLHFKFNQKRASGGSAAELAAWGEWLNFQRQMIQDQVALCQKLLEKMESSRCKLAERQRDEEIWQQLKDKQIEIRNEELKRQEQAELDEISLQSRRFRL
ncbi:flagellar export protein FliJ [Effusibacillus consociatus]|uniref:Flagellar FliJ protein n=1 Tax=Effusibacillus consociatus TaxID=1117041 RepID=A0ABV9Q3M4_9BACL